MMKFSFIILKHEDFLKIDIKLFLNCYKINKVIIEDPSDPNIIFIEY